MITSTCKTKAPAKLNLRLKIIGRRPDGYHELHSIMVPVDLFDLVELTIIPEGIKLTCAGFQVPTNEDNLVYRAAKSFLSEVGPKKGISIKLTKNIPVAAGLGGGSSDAAAALLSLNEMWSRPLSMPDLQDMATQLGADVPFFLHCRPSLARGIGEILEPLKRSIKFWYVIVTPPLQVSTSWVYANLKLELTRDKYEDNIDFLKNDRLPISRILENDLEKITSAAFPIINTIKKHLLDAGAEGALMTGSGPSVFGIFPSLDQAISAKQSLISKGLGVVFVARDWERT